MFCTFPICDVTPIFFLSGSVCTGSVQLSLGPKFLVHSLASGDAAPLSWTFDYDPDFSSHLPCSFLCSIVPLPCFVSFFPPKSVPSAMVHSQAFLLVALCIWYILFMNVQDIHNNSRNLEASHTPLQLGFFFLFFCFNEQDFLQGLGDVN